MYRNLLLPLRTRIAEHNIDSSLPSTDSNSSQIAEPEVPFMDEQEVDSDTEVEPQLATEVDDQSVSRRPWTRSQGPPVY